MNLVLASSSPRRQALLHEAGYRFRVVVPEVEEVRDAGESADAFSVRAARDKARWVARRIGRGDAGDCIVLAADTVVVDGEDSLGKPRDEPDARAMLRRLSGRTHRVVTGVCLWPIGTGKNAAGESFSVSTAVTFRLLTGPEIDAYVASGEPMDKAGAYAIQGGASGMVTRVEGSYSNVVGLPMDEVAGALAKMGW